ncbi:Cadmium%2C zinc and cobalt-transporting ATPase [uncultured Eubacterium sp.]|nr:Cadmium%2C zinc and cobalt-transporting ATPase [uncultured Eubacterium sp.]
MKKTIKLIDLDCAHCAAKIENAVKKLDGVDDANVNFMSQKMILEADDEYFDQVLAEAVKIVKKIEPDVTVKI